MKIYVRVTDDKNQTYEGIMELTKSTKQTIPKKIQIKIDGPTDVIKELYFQNYFENSRTLHDVEQKIKSKKFNFDLTAITKALTRAKYLKQDGNTSLENSNENDKTLFCNNAFFIYTFNNRNKMDIYL